MEYVRKPVSVIPYVFEDTAESIMAIQDGVLFGGEIRVSYREKGNPCLIIPPVPGTQNELTARVGNVVIRNEHGEVQIYPCMEMFLQYYTPVSDIKTILSALDKPLVHCGDGSEVTFKMPGKVEDK